MEAIEHKGEKFLRVVLLETIKARCVLADRPLKHVKNKCFPFENKFGDLQMFMISVKTKSDLL